MDILDRESFSFFGQIFPYNLRFIIHCLLLMHNQCSIGPFDDFHLGVWSILNLNFNQCIANYTSLFLKLK